MSKTLTTNVSRPTQRQKNPKKLLFVQPRIYALGNIIATTGQGGTSDQYDSYDGKRS